MHFAPFEDLVRMDMRTVTDAYGQADRTTGPEMESQGFTDTDRTTGYYKDY
jgi:hypothetical protein